MPQFIAILALASGLSATGAALRLPSPSYVRRLEGPDSSGSDGWEIPQFATDAGCAYVYPPLQSPFDGTMLYVRADNSSGAKMYAAGAEVEAAGFVCPVWSVTELLAASAECSQKPIANCTGRCSPDDKECTVNFAGRAQYLLMETRYRKAQTLPRECPLAR